MIDVVVVVGCCYDCCLLLLSPFLFLPKGSFYRLNPIDTTMVVLNEYIDPQCTIPGTPLHVIPPYQCWHTGSQALILLRESAVDRESPSVSSTPHFELPLPVALVACFAVFILLVGFGLQRRHSNLLVSHNQGEELSGLL